MYEKKESAKVVKSVAKQLGMSESAVYKILANPIEFSEKTVRRVRDACARLHTESVSTGGVSVGIILPARPLYFWKEAVQGAEKCKADWKRLRGVTVRLAYRYYADASDKGDAEQIFASPDECACGNVLFPVSGKQCRAFAEQTDKPLVIFNEARDYMNAEWFAALPNVCYVGADGYDEGVKAASILLPRLHGMHTICILVTSSGGDAQTIRMRVNGFCDGVRRVNPSVEIREIGLDIKSKASASVLAGKLNGCYDYGGLDCIYVTSGVTHVACEAVEKIRRRRGDVRTQVIGHELSAADKRWLTEGSLSGYVKQDVYSQAYAAVDRILRRVLDGKLMQTEYFRSSLFIR